MSVAGILASSIFSNPLSQMGQKPSSIAKSNSPKIPFDLGASLTKPSTQVSGLTGNTSTLSTQITHLGQDLSGGNLPAAQADFSNLQLILSHHMPSTTLQLTGTGSSGSPGINTGQPTADPQSTVLNAAFQAYSSLQQNPINSALNSSMLANNNNLSIDI